MSPPLSICAVPTPLGRYATVGTMYRSGPSYSQEAHTSSRSSPSPPHFTSPLMSRVAGSTGARQAAENGTARTRTSNAAAPSHIDASSRPPLLAPQPLIHSLYATSPDVVGRVRFRLPAGRVLGNQHAVPSRAGTADTQTLQSQAGELPGVFVGSDVAISKRLRRLADQVCHLAREMAARYDGLIIIHDELLEITCELGQQILDPDSP
jgi:hypothetical protein